MITGSTRDEIYASAEAAARRVQEIVGGDRAADDVMRQRAQDIYGPGPSTGSAGASGFPISMPAAHIAREEMRFVEKFNNADRDAYGMRLGISPEDIRRY